MLAALAAGGDPADLEEALKRLGRRGGVLGLASAPEMASLRAALGEGLEISAASPLACGLPGPALVVGSGGSGGRRRWCLQPLAHLEASAAATGAWLRRIGLAPEGALLLNPLPAHHVSGLMPWLRAGLWGAEHRWLPPELMRRPQALIEAMPLPQGRLSLLSLVPTQLHRLLADPAAVDWLRGFSLIWLGGAPLAEAEAVRSRAAGLRLAPCYGSTETASMVAALPPDAFLAGQGGCGTALPHAQLRIAAAGEAVEVRASSLSPGHLEAGRLQPLTLRAGWWRSGDRGRLGADGLELLGRLDGAIHSGGETVFPDQVELALRARAAQRDLPLAALLLLAVDDAEWGTRLAALVRPGPGADGSALIEALRDLAQALPPAQRPRHWCLCPALAANAMGKWDRLHWQGWLRGQL